MMQGAKPSFSFDFDPSSWKTLKKKTKKRVIFCNICKYIILTELRYLVREGEYVKDTEATK